MRMENPMVGSFNRERTRLVFRQRSYEYFASIIGMFVGSAMIANGVLTFGRSGWLGPYWFLFFGAAIFAASVTAYRNFKSIRFDLRRRLCVAHKLLGAHRGVSESHRFEELSHLEVAHYSGLLPLNGVGISDGAPVFVVRLHWKNPHIPPVALEHVSLTNPIRRRDSAYAQFGNRVVEYSNAIGIPVVSLVPLPGLHMAP